MEPEPEVRSHLGFGCPATKRAQGSARSVPLITCVPNTDRVGVVRIVGFGTNQPQGVAWGEVRTLRRARVVLLPPPPAALTSGLGEEGRVPLGWHADIGSPIGSPYNAHRPEARGAHGLLANAELL
jgi:hypothetical protein